MRHPTLFLMGCRAAVCCKLGRHSDAVADAERAIDIENDYQKAYLRRAAGHMGLQDFEAAVRVRSAKLERSK